MVIAHANESERRMVGLSVPKAIILNRQLLNFGWECLE